MVVATLGMPGPSIQIPLTPHIINITMCLVGRVVLATLGMPGPSIQIPLTPHIINITMCLVGRVVLATLGMPGPSKVPLIFCIFGLSSCYL